MINVVNVRLIIVLMLGVFVLGGCASLGASPTPVSTAPAPTNVSSAPTNVSSTAVPAPAQPVKVSSACSLIPPTQSADTQLHAGDIPDTQAFVTYSSAPGRYQLKAPEGWARTVNGKGVSFIDKLDGVEVSITDASASPTAKSVSTNQAVVLEQTGKAVRDVCVQDVRLTTGSAVLIVYTSDSAANSVTGKQVRLENNAYLFFKNGKLATLTFSAPLGADNVDQWKLMSLSFSWV